MNEPPQYPFDDFYVKAFNDLSTCRSFGMSAGPIPWDKIREYAAVVSLDIDLIEPFIDIIRAMDNAYLEWVKKETKTPPKAK